MMRLRSGRREHLVGKKKEVEEKKEVTGREKERERERLRTSQHPHKTNMRQVIESLPQQPRSPLALRTLPHSPFALPSPSLFLLLIN
jgi:hypothetical protein